MIDLKIKEYTADLFGKLPKEKFDEVYSELIKIDLDAAQANLDALPESDLRGLTLNTYRHFGCGYLPNWILTKSRAEFLCGTYVKDDLTREPKHLPPPSERIIIPTTSMQHFNAVATPSARFRQDKKFWKQHAGTMELFCDTDALNADLIVIVEGEIDCMSIWQATDGAVAAVAILGCGNWKATLLPRIAEFKGKKLLLLLDGDAEGKKAAKKFLDELNRNGLLAVNRTLFDAMPNADQKEFGNRPKEVDANSILKHNGDVYLRGLLERIITDAEPEFVQRQKEIEERIREQKEYAALPDATIEDSQSEPSKHGINLIEYGYHDAAPVDKDEIKQILKDYVHARDLTRDDWLNVGRIMHDKGFSVDDFKQWSNDGDSRYDAKRCEIDWNSFRDAQDVKKPVTVATLFYLAAKRGYKPKSARADLPTTDAHNQDAETYMRGLTEDLDNARRLVKFCGDRAKWLTDSELWLIWNNKGVWEKHSEKNSCLAPFVADFADLMMSHAKNLANTQQRLLQEYLKVATNADGTIKTDDDPAIKAAKEKAAIAKGRADKAFAIAYDFRKAKKVSPAISMMKGESSILITQDDLDNHAELLNCLNGVVDLQTGKLYPADPALLLTQQCRAAYNPNAQSELVDKFFRDIMPDEETRAGLLRWLGYCLTGEVIEEKFMVWTGDGGNGKGVLGGTLIELTGDYGTGLTPRALLKNRNDRDADKATTALNSIELARFALSEELPADAELDCSLVKNLTGGDRINLRRNYGEYRTIKPTAKINISGNYTPRLENVFDGGILRRLLNMPFTVRFGTAANPADPHLKKKLLLPENLSAMFALLVRETVAWYRGDGLIISPLMKDATDKHLSQNDFVADFIADNYVFVPTASVKAKDFIEHLRREYPRECARFKRADLIELIAKVDGVTYGDDRAHCRVFKGIGKLANVDDFDGEPVGNDTAMP